MSTNLVIVAIPDENDKVWEVSSEKVPHMTVLFLGDANKVENLDSIMQFVGHAADRSLNRFYLPVDRRGTLGEDEADVLFFKKGRYDYKAINDFRSTLLQDQNIKTAYDSSEQFDGPWKPHLTLGYPETPAKKLPNDQISSFFDVSFNKIGVWTGDYEGPEFPLKDYWDELDELDIPPMSVGEMSMDDLRHVGVKGMRWGVRKDVQVSVNGKSKMVSAKKAEKLDTKFEKRAHSADTFIELHNKAADGINKDMASFNQGFDKKYGTEKMNSGVLHNDNDPITKEYHRAYNELFVKHLNQAAAGMGTSPTGKRRIKIHTSNMDSFADFGWSPTTESVKHADETTNVSTFIVQLDDNGRIISIRPQIEEDAMEQTAVLGVEFLEHVGVKGMRWGVRKDKIASGAKRAGKGLLTVAQDIGFETQASQNATRRAVVSEASSKFNKEDIPRINAKYKGTKAESLKGRLKNPLDKDTRAYRSEARIAYRDRINESVAALPTNASGTRRYEIEDGGKTNTQYHWTLKVVDVKRTAAHADTDIVLDANELLGDFNVRPIFDDDGFITDVKLMENQMAQTHDLGVEFLEHYGIKGMRWGVRKEGAVTTQTHIDAGLFKRRTKIEAKGGEAHDAHPDAVKAAVQKRVLKKSGTAALSNQDLRDLSTRLQLEAQVQQLTTKKGQRLVEKQLEEEGKQQLGRGVRTGVKKAGPHVVRKAKKGAATAAVAALI